MSIREMRQRANNLSLLQDKAKKIGQKNSYEDPEADTYWKLTISKAGKGSATIRFLPPIETEDDAWVQLNSHFFKGPKGWYIENCLSTLGNATDDPMVAYYLSLDKNARKLVERMKTKRDFITNILVIDDPADPTNNGKVFRYKFGPAIMDFLKDALVPEEGEESINPFGVDEGYVFNMVFYTKNEVGKYDKSNFAKDATPLADTDKEIDKILEKVYPLAPLVAPDKFKTKEQLEKRLAKIMGWDEDKPKASTLARRSQVDSDEDDASDDDSKPPFDADESNEDEDTALLAKLRRHAR